MASGRLGALKPTAATWKTLYKPAAGVIAVVSVSFCDQATSDDLFRIAVMQNASADQIPASTELVAGSLTAGAGALVKACGDAGYGDRGMCGPYELNGTNNDQIAVYSVNGNVSFVVTGDEGTV